MVHFDCTAMWYGRDVAKSSRLEQFYSRVKSSAALHRAFNVDPLYLQHENAGVAIDYMVERSMFRRRRHIDALSLVALASSAEPSIPILEALVRLTFIRRGGSAEAHSKCTPLYCFSHLLGRTPFTVEGKRRRSMNE